MLTIQSDSYLFKINLQLKNVQPRIQTQCKYMDCTLDRCGSVSYFAAYNKCSNSFERPHCSCTLQAMIIRISSSVVDSFLIHRTGWDVLQQTGFNMLGNSMHIQISLLHRQFQLKQKENISTAHLGVKSMQHHIRISFNVHTFPC